MNQPPLVSVVIPAFNAGATLAQTIDSVLAQTYPRIEIIVVDDGSTDSTASILRPYGTRIRNLHQANSGLAAARNLGCRAAQGEFIALLDADDLCLPERIAVQAGLMGQRPDVVLCSSEFGAFGSQGRITDAHSSTYYSAIGAYRIDHLYPRHDDLIVTTAGAPAAGSPSIQYRSGNVYEQLALGNFVHPPTVLFRRGLYETAGPFDQALSFTCDWEWFVRASRIGPFAFIATPLLDYRVSENQMSGKRSRVPRALQNLHVLERILKSDPVLFEKNRKRFKREIGVLSLDAADALADAHTAQSLRMLGKSVRQGVAGTESIKVFIKALLPLALIERSRR